MSTKKTLKSKSELKLSTRDRDLPATQGMLHLFRTELRSEMRAGFKQMDARFAQIDSRFAQIDSRFAHIDSRFAHIDSSFAHHDSKFAQIDSRFEQVLSEIARIGILVEEQNSRNRVVMEGLTGLFQRQERVETRVGEVESLVQSLGTRSRT